MANLVRIVCRPAWLLVATLLGALGVFSNAAADGPWMDLQDYFDDLQSFRADFVQEVRRGAARDVSRGVVVLQTPNRFRWDYLEPYRQLVLGDGQRLWHYDPDLEQVTVQRLEDVLAQSPLSQLMSGTPIIELFRVERIVQHGGGERYRLLPLGSDADFGAVELAFRDGELAVLELEDALGQQSRVEFFAVVRNGEVAPETWEFTVPPGTDVIGDV